MAIRVVVAEDSLIVREGLRQLLATSPSLDVVAAHGDLDAVLGAMSVDRPDVVLTDIRMPPSNTDEGIRLADHLRERHPATGVSSLARSIPSDDSLQRSQMRLLVTGGTGVLGHALRPLAEAAGHELTMPGHDELDLFDPFAVAEAVRDVDGVLHLATRIRSLERVSDPDAWRENDRLRADASRHLVEAAIAAGLEVYVQPTVTFVYPPDGAVSEDTPVREVLPILRSALVAEEQTERFARAGARGVVLRFGLLDGPGTWYDQPMGDFGATLHVSDAGRALLSALSLPSGIYNVCRDGERVSSERFTRAAGWHPQR